MQMGPQPIQPIPINGPIESIFINENNGLNYVTCEHSLAWRFCIKFTQDLIWGSYVTAKTSADRALYKTFKEVEVRNVERTF